MNRPSHRVVRLARTIAAVAISLGVSLAFAQTACENQFRALPEEGGEWRTARHAENLVVLSRAPEGRRVREMLARARIDESPWRLYQAISDLDEYENFMPYVERADVLGEDADGASVYFEVELPFVARRYYTILLNSTTLGPDCYRVSWRPTPSERSPSSGRGVEVLDNQGFWLLRSTDGGDTTDLAYSIYTDPGGKVFRWIINRGNTVAVPRIIAEVTRRAGDPRYTDAPGSSESAGTGAQE